MIRFGRIAAGVTSVIALVASSAPALASTPSSDTVTVPTAGQEVTISWSGIVPTGGDGCTLGGTAGAVDTHQTTVSVPSGLYDTATSTATFTVGWADGLLNQDGLLNDEMLQVADPLGNTVASSDGGTNVESASVPNISAGTYTVSVCPSTTVWVNTSPVPYTASLTIKTTAISSTAGGFTDAVQFTPATVVDPVLFGGEPGLHFDPTVASGDNSFVDWPVSSRQNIGVLFKSTDGATTYSKRYADYGDLAEAGPACLGRQVPFCGSGGGGDTAVEINSGNGILYMSSQEALANEAVGTSFDHGTTFPAGNVDPVAAQSAGDVDRQWLASWKNTSTVFLAYHSPVVGEFVMRSDEAGKTGSWHNAGTPGVPQITGVTQSGALVADNTGGPNNRTLYLAYLPFLVGSGFTVGVSNDGGKTFVTHPVPGGGNARNFTKIFLDNAGNLYATWVDSGTQKTYLSTSLASDLANVGHPATKWSAPVVVSHASQHVTIFPDGVAGSPGRIGVVYYGTTANAADPDSVTPGQGGWYPILAESTNALCQWAKNPCSAPAFTQSHIAHQINSDDNICTAGTTCAATGGDRNLLDYFTPSLDRDGHVGVVWSDNTNPTLMPYVKVSRQATGPSLYAGGPSAHLSLRGNGAADPSGDALYPTSGNQVLSAPNHPQLDLLGSSVSPQYVDGNLRFTIKLSDTSDLANAVPGGGTGLDGLTPLQQAKYLVRWDYQGNSYYVGANLAAGSTSPAFFSGTVASAEALNAAGGTTPYGNTYAATGPATGTVNSGSLTITVPASAVGSPQPGDRLVSVGSYTLLGPVDSAAVLNTAPIQADSTPTYDYVMPAAPSSAQPQPALGSEGPPGTPGWAGPLALLFAAAVWLVRNRQLGSRHGQVQGLTA